MNPRYLRSVLMGIAALASTSAAHAAPLGTAFTYQGQLKKAGGPVSTACNMTFGLWDAVAGGVQKGSPVGPDLVPVVNGLFTWPLDFGADAFNGEARWLEISVQCGVDPLTTLSPRQELKPAPHALALPGLYTQQNATSPNLIGGHHANTVSQNVVGATIGGGGTEFAANTVAGDFGTVGGGTFTRALGTQSTVGGGNGNTALGTTSTIAGGAGNNADGEQATISGGEANTASAFASTIGGGNGNQAAGEASTVGGGNLNSAGGLNSTVGGGIGNTAAGPGAVVAGGAGNNAGGVVATIGGGFANNNSGHEGTIGGGAVNTVNARRATVGGGGDNTASGYAATVPGGQYNVALGFNSFAAGQQAKANHDGTFVWADSTGDDFPSTGPDQFLIRARGGMWFGTTSAPDIPAGRFINTSTEGYLTTGGVWTDSSDRDAKENFERLDHRVVLERLAEVPITRWNFKVQERSIQHIGPVAQDFHAVFGTGEDEKHLAALDTAGVALAAIQGLYEIVQEKDCEIEELEARLTRMESLLEALTRKKGDEQ